MNKTTFILLLLLPNLANADLLGLTNPSDMAGQHGKSIYTSAQLFVANDFTAANNINGNWAGTYSPRDGSNLAIGTARVEGGVTYDSWRLAAFNRAEIFIQTNRDMTDLIYLSQQKLSVPSARTFNPSVAIEGFEAKGLRLDKGFNFAINDGIEFSYGAGFSVLQGTQVRIGTAFGSVDMTTAGYAYNISLEDSYSSATYPYISSATPYGRGYAMDFGAKLAWKNGTHLDFAANDIMSQITWYNMPHTVETASSQNISSDANGNIIYNPALSGKNDINRSTLVQTLMPKMHTQFNYPVSDFDLFAGTSWMAGYWFPEIGTQYRIRTDSKILLSYETRFCTVAMGMQYKWVDITLRSSNINFDHAKSYGINAGIHVPF